MGATWLRELTDERAAAVGSRPLPRIPSLDGLRAVAVIAVLLFHGSVAGFSGGFLGVDVFFVLSGFLITALLLAEAEARGRVDLLRFYLGRARRLLPALLLVLVGTALLALTVARDAALQVRNDIVGALTYTTNWWYVVGDHSYFEASGRPPLLQHLWSLAVEEQFYLVWPLLLVLLWRAGARRRTVRRWAVAGAVASTALMVGWSAATGVPGTADSSRVYFGSDTHAMGLLVGAALATLWRPGLLPSVVSPRTRGIGTAVGGFALAVVLASFVLLNESSPFLFRGGFLVLAVATAVVIAALSHPALPFARVFAHRAMTYVGSRSYGIYLWHWPIFMVTRPGIDVVLPSPVLFAARLALTFGAAELSYRYVEMPIRRGALARLWKSRHGPVHRRRVAAVVAAVAVLPVLVLGTALTQAAQPGAEQALGGVTGIGDGPLAPVPSTAPTRAGEDCPGTRCPAAPVTGVTAVGDSVLLDAAPQLKDEIAHLTVDARIGRQPYDIFERIRARERAGRLGSSVIINAGSNGLVRADELSDILRLLSERERVVVVTARGRKSWVAGSNRAITKVTPRFANARVADWAAESKGKRDWFWQDGLHMRDKGAERYAGFVAGALD